MWPEFYHGPGMRMRYPAAENSSKPAGTCLGVLPSITSRATSTLRSTVSGL